jgi:hypothetical protein
MSQRRRRRRRRRGGGGGNGPSEAAPAPQQQGPQQVEPERRGSRRRRRRGRRGSGRTKAPETLEDVIAAARPPRPEQLTAEDDGQRLEEIIGDLQSTWGVPQYPQEFRITYKVPEEKDAARPSERPSRPVGPTGVTREKAPAAPRVTPEGAKREKAPRRRRARRRRRSKGGSSEG